MVLPGSAQLSMELPGAVMTAPYNSKFCGAFSGRTHRDISMHSHTVRFCGNLELTP